MFHLKPLLSAQRRIQIVYACNTRLMQLGDRAPILYCLLAPLFALLHQITRRTIADLRRRGYPLTAVPPLQRSGESGPPSQAP